MTVDDLKAWIAEHKEEFIASLLDGTYQPQPVRGVQIPKPGGGVRQLGIPTVVDRLVQQAILQVLEKLLDPTFSDSSFGFRPGRGAHDALAQASRYVAEGRHHRGGPRSGEVLRPGEPRHPDVAAGPAHRRQASAADHSPLPGSGADAKRRVRRAARRDAARRTPVPAVGEPASGRPGPGTRTAWPRVLPLCGRLQHLCAVAGGGRTGAGVGDEVSRRAVDACVSTGPRVRWRPSRNASSSDIVCSPDGTLTIAPQESGTRAGTASARSRAAIEA